MNKMIVENIYENCEVSSYRSILDVLNNLLQSVEKPEKSEILG